MAKSPTRGGTPGNNIKSPGSGREYNCIERMANATISWVVAVQNRVGKSSPAPAATCITGVALKLAGEKLERRW